MSVTANGRPFLLEIGAEEIPDWMIEAALEDLKGKVQRLLDEERLGGTVTRVEATPRRLVLWAEGLSERQADAEELVLGPPKSAAYKDGQLTGAALGFARKMGTDAASLGVESTPKGEYLSFRKQTPGRETSVVLAEALPTLIPSLVFPKTMYWTGRAGPRFIRPIRWLVALLGESVVPFEVAGVASGDTTRGHRQLSPGTFAVTIADYEAKLREASVIVSQDERVRRIDEVTQVLLGTAGLSLKEDAALRQTLGYLTEFPTPILGAFEDEFLALPEEVLVTVMRHHQRYFSLVDGAGKLAPRFVAVTNTAGDPQGLIRRGHERVLRARFKDGRFFYEVDGRRRLEDRLEDLEAITFQAKIGNYRQKTDSVVVLALALVRDVPGLDYTTRRNLELVVQRAALLCKCDLPTDMVKEFTELQGVVGGLYARRDGEAEEVAQAIYDHYRPLSMEDALPRTAVGQLVALADKLDTLRGCFRVGLIPSGSKDPFALRRAAQGVVRILVETPLGLPFDRLAEGDAALREFLLERVRYYFRETRGYAYDEVNAVLAAGTNDLGDVAARLAAVQAVRPTPDFEPLAASFKRIRNILKQAQVEQAAGDAVDESLLEAGPERELHAAFQPVRASLTSRRQQRDYAGALAEVATLRPQVDLFFDKVLVNAPDERVRRNRLSLLQTLLAESSTIADFSEIVTSSN